MNRTNFDTTIGPCAILWTDRQVTGFHLIEETPAAWTTALETPAWIAKLIRRVQSHLKGDLQDFADVNYDFSAVSDFARQVYLATLAIKPGQTRSYGDIAQALGQPPAVSRAVGMALAANPWPLIIPCHRVVAASGKMTGFSASGGIKTKLRLLALEGAQLFAE